LKWPTPLSRWRSDCGSRDKDRSPDGAGSGRADRGGRSLGILTDEEAQLLSEYDRKVMQIINVDDFDPHELAGS
jgi:hypothetical protein